MRIGGNVISQNFVVLSLGQLLSRMLAFAVTVQLTRVLLPDQYGAIVFATSVVLYVGIVVDLGFEALGPLEVARGLLPIRGIVQAVLTMRGILVLPALVGLAAVTSILPMPGLTKTIILLYGLTLLPAALDISWFFLGSRMMLPAMVADILCQTLLAISIFFFVKTPGDAILVPIALFACRCVSIAYLLVHFIRNVGPISFGIDLCLIKNLVPRALPLSGSAVVGRVIENFDILLVGLWIGAEATGLYGASYRIVWMLILLSVSYYTALRPSLAQAYVNGFHTIENLLARTMRISTAVAIGTAAGGIVLAKPLVELLFGKAYLGSVTPFQILLIFFALHMISRTYRVLLISFNRQANDLRIMSAAAVVNVVLNIILIKRYGIAGSACANVGSEMLILLLNYISTQVYIRKVPLGRHLWRPTIAAGGMIATLMAIHSLPVIVQVALGGCAYLAMLWAMRAITPDDIRAIFKDDLQNKRDSKVAATDRTASKAVMAGAASHEADVK